MAMAILMGMSGSLRWGIRRYPNVPQMTVATSVIHAMCRFSVKTRAVFRSLASSHSSVRWAMAGSPFESGNDADALRVGGERRAAHDDPLAACETRRHSDQVAAHVSELDATQACHLTAALILHQEHGVAARVPWRPHHRVEGDEHRRVDLRCRARDLERG